MYLEGVWNVSGRCLEGNWNLTLLLCGLVLASFETENGTSTGSTSHGFPELMLIFLESVELGEWENTQS